MTAQDPADAVTPASQTPVPDAAVTDDPAGEPEPLTTPADGVPPVLTTPAEFAAAAAALAAGSGPVALDTERASGFRYSGRAYLIQIRRQGAGSFLVDPIDAPQALTPLTEVLDGPEWVLHAADQDLPCLRELGFRCAQLFDTELGGRLLGVARVNLATMVAEFLGLGLAKGHGAADWSQRPLPDDWLNYAALDVEVLVELRDAVATALADQGKDRWAAEEFEYVRTRPDPAPRTDRWRRTSQIHTVRSPRQLAVVRELWEAREEVARNRDVAPGRVLPDKAMVEAATASPTSLDDLLRLPVFKGPRQRRQARRWWGAIERARALPDADLPARGAGQPGLPPVSRWRQRNPDASRRFTAVRAELTGIAETHGVPAENLLQPDLVRQLCWDGLPSPVTAESVDARLSEGSARRWQRELTVAAIAAALVGADAQDDTATADD
ncbi:HRDC domain-containing protein [Williamsia sterculiae]|uniref:Ribonuclease D n=1 Tax=Williamsia sterculiae TaxID=1344003 RepID=A0A1N7EFP4_9NOCA|nr:ribonuclease D [Williamsia sterculiae]SIR86839.1 ribonuclease D [Williamsia sterculiae]